MAKLLSGYGNRVQKSAFEARLDKKRYARLLMDIKKLLKADDNVRIYKLYSYEEILSFGDRKYEDMTLCTFQKTQKCSQQRAEKSP